MENLSKILILPGSLRNPSYSYSLAYSIRQSIQERGVDCSIWDLRVNQLPFADPKYHHNPEKFPNEQVQEFIKQIKISSAVIFITPIYHNGLSGVLKNAIDWLKIPYLYLKPVGLASHGGNRTSQAVEQLRIITRGLHSITIPTQICTSNSDFSELDKNNLYLITNQSVQSRIERFCNELIVMAKLLPIAHKSLA